MTPNAFDVAEVDEQVVALLAHGDRGAREKVVELMMPLVEQLARRFAGRGEPLEDLTQVASVGLLKAMGRFEAERGVRFTSYATPTIIGELKRYFRDSGWAVHIPRRLKERALAIRDVAGTLSQELGRSPTAGELAGRTGFTVEEVVEALEAAMGYSPDSLDATHEDRPARIIGSEDEALELTEGWASIAPSLRALEERERRILYLRFVKGYTQEQIGRELGYSQMHVSRLLERTLERLRARARA